MYLHSFFHVSWKELSERLGVDDIALILQQNRLRWYGHVLRKDDDDWVKKCMVYEVEGSKPRGRPKKTCKEVVREDCQARKLNKEDAVDHKYPMRASWPGEYEPPVKTLGPDVGQQLRLATHGGRGLQNVPTAWDAQVWGKAEHLDKGSHHCASRPPSPKGTKY